MIGNTQVVTYCRHVSGTNSLIEIVLPSCRLQYITGVYIADCRAGYIITYIVIILGNMQAAALQRQLVLKSYNWPWWSTCTSQCTASNSPPKYTAATLAYGRELYIYFMHIYSAELGFIPSGHLSS